MFFSSSDKWNVPEYFCFDIQPSIVSSTHCFHGKVEEVEDLARAQSQNKLRLVAEQKCRESHCEECG